MDNMIIDFEGEVTTETVRGFLRKDEGPVARALLQKIIEDKGIDDLVIALADVLKANIANGIDSGLIREHLVTYSES
jgi:predicted GTPase